MRFTLCSLLLAAILNLLWVPRIHCGDRAACYRSSKKATRWTRSSGSFLSSRRPWLVTAYSKSVALCQYKLSDLRLHELYNSHVIKGHEVSNAVDMLLSRYNMQQSPTLWEAFVNQSLVLLFDKRDQIHDWDRKKRYSWLNWICTN